MLRRDSATWGNSFALSAVQKTSFHLSPKLGFYPDIGLNAVIESEEHRELPFFPQKASSVNGRMFFWPAQFGDSGCSNLTVVTEGTYVVVPCY